MIKLFSLIFYLCQSPLQGPPRGEGYASTSLYPPNHQLRYNSKIKNYYELMSHLLYLNSCDNYPNKCPHICLHLLVKQHPIPPGLEYPVRSGLFREAHYTHSASPRKAYCRNNSGYFYCAKLRRKDAPELHSRRPNSEQWNQVLTITDRRCFRVRRRTRHTNKAAKTAK